MLDRRTLLRTALANATTLWLARSSWSQPRWESYPFALGVASGAPTHNALVLWTRLVPSVAQQITESAITVRWEIAHDPQFQRIVQSGQAQALAVLGYCVHVEVAGLAADRWYFYRFMAGDAVSPLGKTRTFPEASSQSASLRLAYASCQKWEDGYFAAWRHMQAENVDAVLFLGDYIYEYPGTSSRLRKPGGGWVLSLEDFRRRYALYKTDPDLQAMHASAPWLMTWDDHEVQNDYAGEHSGNSGNGKGAPQASDFATRRAAAYQAYYENMPLRANVLAQALGGRSPYSSMRLYTQVQYGKLATIYLLDARQYKDPQACTPDGQPGSGVLNPAQCSLWADPARSMLGHPQEAWLRSALSASAAQQVTWNVLAQQTLFGQRNLGSQTQARFWNDGWDGYRPARTRLTDSLQKFAVPNPVFLGGDVHENWVGNIKADYQDPQSKTVGVEFCGTSISARSNKSDISSTLAQNPHFVFADAKHRGYGIAHFTPKSLRVYLRGLDDATLPESGMQTLASFQVSKGQSEIVAAT
jgi:alkaline phosphatase D